MNWQKPERHRQRAKESEIEQRKRHEEWKKTRKVAVEDDFKLVVKED